MLKYRGIYFQDEPGEIESIKNRGLKKIMPPFSQDSHRSGIQDTTFGIFLPVHYSMSLSSLGVINVLPFESIAFAVSSLFEKEKALLEQEKSLRNELQTIREEYKNKIKVLLDEIKKKSNISNKPGEIKN